MSGSYHWSMAFRFRRPNDYLGKAMTFFADIHSRSERGPETRHCAIALFLCLAVAAGCVPVTSPDPQVPGRSVETAQAPGPGSDGIIAIGDSKAILSMPGDTLSTIAARAGLSVEQLAHFNGIGANYHPRPGEVFALPPAGSNVRSASDLAAIAESAIGRTDSVLTEEPLPAIESDEVTQSPSDEEATEVESAESEAITDPVVTLPIARQFEPREDTPDEPVQVASAPENEDGATNGAGGTVAVADPMPRDQLPESGGKLLVPVEGQIARPYSGSPGGNHGIDFSARAGSSVRASDDGSVVLVSPSETHTTIVLIRHDDNLYTVYSRITGVTVKKGDPVTRGQIVGRVVEGSPSLFHYQVRQGTESVDPVPLLYGETR